MRKLDYLQKQKKTISETKEFLSENQRELLINKLNLMSDDFEKTRDNITKDNIHLYYEFMSDEEKYISKKLLLSILADRKMTLDKLFGFLPEKENQKPYDEIFNNNPDYSKQILLAEHYSYRGHKKIPIEHSYFGIKDTLKPIEEYIADIKDSSEYKEYVLKQLIRFDIKEFERAYNKKVLVCEKYPEITKGKAKMICDDIFSIDPLKVQYDNTIKNIIEYLG